MVRNPLAALHRMITALPRENIRNFSSATIVNSALFLFERIGKSPVVALAETPASPALKYFERQGWTVLNGPGKRLKQIAVFVPINQNAESFEFVQRFLDASRSL